MSEPTEIVAITIIGAFFVVINLAVLCLNIKLFTEFAKQRMQETRSK